MYIFISNFVSPHTIPFAEELYKQLKGEFLFIETRCMTAERRGLGYDALITKPFVISFNTFVANKNKYQVLIDEAEIVLASYGSIDTILLEKRILEDKLTFLMSERIFKKGLLKILDPRFWRTIGFIKKIRQKRFHLLCMGAYVPSDFQKCGFPKERMWNFGYLTAGSNKTLVEILLRKGEREPLQFLWVGRFIWWKRPWQSIRAAKKLLEKGFNFELSIIGSGKLEKRVCSLIKKWHIEEHVHFLGKRSNTEVRDLMEQSHVLLCTSNRLEGWGAVINEGMDAAMLVVANSRMGAAPSLIKNKETGILYTGGSKHLSDTMEGILTNKGLLDIAQRGYEHLHSCWNAETAAIRFLDVAKKLLNGDSDFHDYEGICEKIQK